MNTRHSLGALMALFMDTYFFSPGEIIYIYIYIYKFSKHYEIWHTCSWYDEKQAHKISTSDSTLPKRYKLDKLWRKRVEKN
jgi:hypothetical protein